MAQFLRPSSDITVGAWTPTPLYQQIDEQTASDVDFIESSSVSYCEVGLSVGQDPGVSAGHIVRYRYGRSATNRSLTLVVRLMQGTTEVASWTHVDPAQSFVLAEQTLTTTQTDSITDYSNLRLRFDVTAIQNSQTSGQISWAELEIPDPPTPLTSQDIFSGTPTVGQSLLAQLHVISSQEIISQIITESPVLSQQHNLGATSISSQVDIEQPNIEVTSILASQEITIGTPTVEQPSLSETNILTSQNISSVPTFEQSSIAQVHNLSSQELTSNSFLEQSTLGITFVFSSQKIISGTPVIDAPEAEGFAELTGQEIHSQVIFDVSTITQHHSLVVDGLSSTAIIDKPVGSLPAQDIKSQSTIEYPTIYQQHNLEASGIISGEGVIDTPITFNPADIFPVPDLISTVDVESPFIFGLTDSQQEVMIEEDSVEAAGSVAMLDGAVIGRAALGQNDLSFSYPTFINTPYIIVSVPNGFETEIEVSINFGAMGEKLSWGIDEQSGCGTAYFGNDPTTWGEETQGQSTNTLYFTPSATWTPPYRVGIYVTDGYYTIRTSVFIYFAGALTMPAEVSMDDYEIFLADREFNLGAQIDNFVDATFVIKYNDVGTFTISMDIEDVTNFENKVIAGWGEPNTGTYGNILLTRNGTPLFWGMVKEFERDWDADKDLLVMKGEDTMSHLKARLALPKTDRITTTSSDGEIVPVYSTTIYDVRPMPTIGAVSYSGSGNSASNITNIKGAGASVKNTTRQYRIWIVKKGSDGAPDEFAWKEVNSGNADMGGIKITGKAQSIDNAVVSIQFSKINGFTLGSYSSNYWTFTFQQSSMYSEQVIKSYVTDNIGSGALPFRQVAGLSVEALHTPVLGNLARGRARFDNLLELLQDIALPDLSLPKENRKPVHFYMDALTFRVREIADLTNSVKLSKDLDTMRRFKYNAKASTGNYLYVGGKGSEGEREFIEWANDEGSIPKYGLIEHFVDANGGETITDLYATAIEELAKTQDNTVLEVEPIDKPFMTLIDDYWVGDKVTAIVDGSEFQEIIREATIKIDANEGVTITPVLGTPDTRRKELLTLFKTVRKIDSRLGGFERR